mgnify:FL=1
MLENLLQEAEQAKNAGDNEKTVQIYRQIIQLAGNDESEAPQLAFCLQELAQIYLEYGQYREAVPLYQQLIALGGRILGTEHPDIIRAGVNLGRAFEGCGEVELADEEYKLATSKAEKAFGISHPMAQEIRQEYFDAVANRQVVEEDKLRHGLTLEPASKNPNISGTFPTLPTTNSVNRTASELNPVVNRNAIARPGKKYSKSQTI